MGKKIKELQKAASILRNTPGVYIFRDEKNKPLYVGKAVNLKNRVRSYFQSSFALGAKTKAMVGKIERIEHIEVESEIEALILEADLIKRLKPYYNVQWKDDKTYKYVRIARFPNGEFSKKQKTKNKEQRILSHDFARIITTRKTDDTNSLYFGPFPKGRIVNKVLSSLRRIFGFADCSKTKFNKHKKLGRGCLYADLNLCPAPCIGAISPFDYQKQIKHIIVFLQGKKKSLLQNLQKEMKRTAKKSNFEQAAKLRDEIKRMEYITQTFRDTSEYLDHPDLLEDKRRNETETLIKELSACQGIRISDSFRIEAYDISNISGKKATGSRVVFINGEPDKSQYRRYKIKIEGTPNDVGMLRDVLARRLRRLAKLKVEIPNLILVDGGIGQVNAAQDIVKKYNLKIPVIGLAKTRETLYVPTELGIKQVFLPRNSPALKLLQRIRDEAHRFAVSYHRKLRKKELLG